MPAEHPLVRSPGPPFVAEATLSHDDVAAYTTWLETRSYTLVPRPGMIPYTTMAFVTALTATLAAVSFGILPAERGGPLAGLFLLAFFVGIYTTTTIGRRYHRKVARRRHELSRHARLPCRWEIGVDGLGISDDVSQGMFRWQAFTDLVETGGLLILIIGGAEWTIVPLRAFPSPAHAADAKAYAEARIGTAASNAPATPDPGATARNGPA